MGAPETPILNPHEQAANERRTIVRWVRMAFLIVFSVVTVVYVLEPLQGQGGRTGFTAAAEFQATVGWWIILGTGVGLATLVLLLDLMTPNKRIATVSGILFGLLAGLLVTWALSSVIDLLMQTYEVRNPNLVTGIKVLLGMALCYLAISIILQTQDDFRLVIPYVEFTKQYRGSTPLILDTSALIDGRIVEVCGTGFVQVPVVIPQSVIAELHALSDSGDKIKRGRGKRGLEMVARLQRAQGVDLSIDTTPLSATGVDQQLVELALQMPGTVVTADNALNRVASIRGVTVLNLNDLSNALRPSLVVGSVIRITLVRTGEQAGQGVGYLDDGTMVVVEQAASLVGGEAEVEISGSLQTSAGRLVFAKVAGAAKPDGGGGADAAVPVPGARGGVSDADGEGGGGREQTDAGAGSTTGLTAASGEAAPGVTAPVSVRPPAPTPPVRTPFPPNKAPRNPLRNPRR